MNKVLIITYYWLPSGGAGVQRWVKFTKYLRDFGWEPVIYTPENPEYPSFDDSFRKDIATDIEVIKIPIWEPFDIYRTLLGKRGQTINAGFISENGKKGWKDKLSVWIRGNFLIPDPRKFWVRPSVNFLSKYLKEHPVNAIITTGPPHSMHLIGMGLKKIFPDIKWLADFRDPWTNIDFYKDLHLTKWADKKHHNLEKKVVSLADEVIVVSAGMRDEFRLMRPDALHIIPNGYDEDDVKIARSSLDKKFTISHIGTMNAARNPLGVWKALQNLCVEDDDFSRDLVIQLIGKTDFAVLEAISQYGLTKNLNKITYLTHDEAIKKQHSSQVLLLLINRSANAKGILTGKFFEYLASDRPVLGIGPVDGDAAAILNETGAGIMVDFDDVETAQETILHYYKLYKKNQLTLDADSVDKYSRKNLTGNLSDLLNHTTANA
ncbi:MAG: glycosyltransferase [Paludibacter sp.]|nr:glycosyltransferase [Paludibacter sp.]